MKYNERELISIIYGQLQRAADYSTASLAETREQAWNYYLNRARGDELPGRSSVQDTSVRDTVHALMATIAPTYDCDSLIDFPPNGPDDVDQADAEARALNTIFRAGDNINELNTAIFDALLFRNGVVKTWVEEREEVEFRRFSEPPGMVSAALEAQGIDAEYEDTDDNGISTFKIRSKQQELRVRAIEPAYFYCDPNQDKASTRGVAFLSERFISTRSELIQLGVSKKVAMALPSSPDDSITEGVGSTNGDILAKNIDGVSDINGNQTMDQQHIQCYWVHMLIDLDGDGISEKWRFLVSNEQLLMKDPVTFFPYSSGSGWPVPHRWSGLGVYDILKITQDEMTAARRQMQDGLALANNPRPIADPGNTNFDDLLSAAPGRAIRSRDPAGVGWMPQVDVTSQSMAYLQYMKSIRSEQAGAALDMMTADQQGLKSISGLSAEMQLGPAEAMAANVSRNIANSMIKDAFLKMHRTLREEWTGPIMFYKAGEWVETDPSQWRSRTNININVALSPGERRRHSANLEKVMQFQQMIMQAGGNNLAVDLNCIHKATTDWMRANSLDDAEQYFIDPMSQQGRQSQQMASQSQQQQQQMQMQMAQMQMQMEQQRLQLEAMKVQGDIADDQFDNETDRLKLQLEYEKAEAELTLKAVQGESRESEDSEGTDSDDKPGRKRAA
jgi:hypothetical protein